MFETLRKAFRLPELRNRIFFTLMMFVVIRLGTYIPVPGIDRAAVAQLVGQGGFLGLLDLFSGGGIANFSIFSLSVLPYINASIIIELLGSVIPALEELRKEGGKEGQRKIAKYTRYLTLGLGIIESFGVVAIFQKYLSNTGFFTKLLIVLSLTAGSYIVLWFGEMMTEKGIGNGVSLIIFSGIVSRIPVGLAQAFRLTQAQSLSILGLVGGIIGTLVLLLLALFAYQGERKIPVQYAKRVVGRKVYGGQSTYIPLKLVQAGVLPIIFASTVLMFPATVSQFWSTSWFYTKIAEPLTNSATVVHNVVFAVLIVFFTYFYTEITYDPTQIADDLKKYGGYVPGVRPGEATAQYIKNVLDRIVLPTAIFLAFLAIVPNIAMRNQQIPAFAFGGTSLLIIIGVALETVQEIEAYMMMRHYKGFMK
ncbi:MAG TPA: preprotein translocase subunit SecY [Candidatus Cryosericum sp.]|nr:preprotein translocase subunit SecY [Candidatus Cryosericum sp.]HPS70222.1 preprotein translocase subunit SecY [Candidatus Cryosericum sp.]